MKKMMMGLLALAMFASSSAFACGVGLVYDPANHVYGDAAGAGVYDQYSAQSAAQANCANCSANVSSHWAVSLGNDSQAWVALAVSPSGHWGVSVSPYNDSQADAEQDALSNCPAADCSIKRSIGAYADYWGNCQVLNGQQN